MVNINIRAIALPSWAKG